MHLDLDYVLKRIKSRVVCVIDKERKEFASGDEAYKVYGDHGQNEEYYIVDEISAENDAVILFVRDIRPEINESVRKYEEDHFKQFGRYPNRFDGA